MKWESVIMRRQKDTEYSVMLLTYFWNIDRLACVLVFFDVKYSKQLHLELEYKFT